MSSTVTSTQDPFDEEAYQRMADKSMALNAQFFRAPIIDLSTYKPPSLFTFQCTADLKGRLYPCPGLTGNYFYYLDFIDDSGTRRDNTNLYVHHCEFGGSKTGLLEPLTDKWGNCGDLDLYILNPHFTYKIYDAKQQQLKRVAFMYLDGTALEPIVRD